MKSKIQFQYIMTIMKKRSRQSCNTYKYILIRLLLNLNWSLLCLILLYVIYNLWKSSSSCILLRIFFLKIFKKYKLYRRIAFVSCHSYIDKRMFVILNLHWSWSRYVQLILFTFLCVICILEWHPFVLCFNFKSFNAFIVPLGPAHNFIFTHSYLIIIFNRLKL